MSKNNKLKNLKKFKRKIPAVSIEKSVSNRNAFFAEVSGADLKV